MKKSNRNLTNKNLEVSKKIIKGMHYFMLFIMLHITFIVPAHEAALVYRETFKTLKLHSYLSFILPNKEKYNTSLITTTPFIKNRVSPKKIILNNFNKTLSTNISNEVSIINADLKEGIIGVSKTIPMDNPSDNLFKFTINEMPSIGDKVVLKYELYGVEDQNSVARSINNRFSIGGHIIKTTNQWSTQTEELNIDWLNKGENKILFTTEKESNYQYKIKNIHLEITKGSSQSLTPLLVVQSSDITLSKDNKIYLKGFLRNSQNSEVTIDVEGTTLKQQSSEFEGFIDLNLDIQKKGFVVVRAYDSKGLLGQQLISLADKLEEADAIYLIGSKKTFDKVAVMAFEKSKVAIDGASLEIVDSSLVENKLISISELRHVDFAPLSSDLTNVTKFSVAYRFLPDGTLFAKPVPVTISYDPKLLPFGYTAKDIKTFYFDTKNKTWQTIPVVSFDEKNHTITSLTTHFTDYINGIIKVPESPETNAYTPTSMSGIKIANPGEKINLIQAPIANQQGDANLSYPIEIPFGRGGMQPNLSVSYNSSNSNGWMGLGWNISSPSIELDTRWGSPTFDSSTESEIYTIGGEQLLLKSSNGFYLANKSNSIGRITNAMFYERVEGSFNKIQRVGSSPSTYSWTVTDKSGTISTYGSTTDAVLTNNTGNIARWMLKKVQDINGNSMEYFYTTKTFTDGTTSGGKQIYLQRIEYTKHASLAAPYSVVFNKTTVIPKADGSSFTREDKSINARLGFKEITDDVLESIEVKYGAALVRKYKFTYKQGVFKKTLLDRIQQTDGADAPFNEHTMEYYDDTNNGQNIFGNEISVSGLSKDGGDLQGLFSTTLGASHTSSYSASIGATVGYVNSLLFFETLIPISQSGTGGVTGGISGTDTIGKITLIDVNGDGLPDKLFNSSTLGYRKNLGNSFSSAISIPSMNEFTRSNSFSKSLGIRANFTSGAFVGVERIWTNSYTNSYLEDVNGDGLIDVVKDRKVYFNSLNSSATPTFTTLSSNTPNIIYQGLTVPPVANTLATPILNNPVFDVVKVWRAPYTGTVAITGTVTLPITPLAPADGIYFSIETGNFLNEFPLPSQTSTVSTTPINILTAQGYPITLNAITPTKIINSTLSVTKGQRIYFRANTISNDKDDLVNFNTNQININYTNPISTVATMPNANQLDAEQISYVNNNASDGFVVSAEQKISLPINGNYTISYPAFTISNPTATGGIIPELSDEVQLLIEKHTRTIVTNPSDNSVVSDIDAVTLLNTTPTRIKVNTVNTIPAFSILDVVTSIDVDNTDNSTTQAYYMFKIDAKSNVDWKKLNDNWKPKIVMPIPDNSVPGSTTTDVYPIPYLSIYNEKTRTTDTSIVTPTTIEKYANYIIPPAMNLTGTTRKFYQMQPIFPSVSGVNKFNQCTTCTSNVQIRKLYLTVKGTNKNLLFHNTTATTATMPTVANQLVYLAKYEISIDNNGNIISTATGATNSGIKRFNTGTGLYDINITGTTSSTVPQSTLINVIFDAIDNGTTTPLLINNNRIYFEYFTDDVDISNSLANVPFGSARIRAASTAVWTYANNLATAAIYPNIFYKQGINYFGSNYRNWGQFAYRTEKTGTTTLAIRESELIPNAPLTTTQQTAAQNAISACGSANPPLSDSAYQTCVEEALYPPANNPLRRMLSLIPDASLSGSTYYKRWKGSQTNMFVADKEMSPKNKYDETVPTTNLPIPTITSTSEAFGIVKETKSTSNSASGGLGVGAFLNFGDNKVLNDHRDINGDSYPDFIDETSFQLTNKLGNLYPIIPSIGGYRQDSNGNGWGFTSAGNIPKFNYVPKGSNGTTTNQTTNAGSGKDIGFNGSQTFSSDESKNILLDINGDGLTDRVDVNGVNLNIGGSSSLFEGISNWNYGAVQKGNTASIATGVGLVGSLFTGSVTFGLGIGTSTSPPPLNNNSETFLDINGDGLVDKIEGSTVRYNLGTTFDNTPTTINNFDKSHQSVSANASLNAGFTACFYFPIFVPLIPPFVFYITGPKFCACGNGSLGYGINSENLQMVDVNGDGFLDIASSSSENELKVRYSNIGRTNMLKTVNRPLGATITLDYAITNPIDGAKIGNTYKMPFAKWAMTSVVVNDGHLGDGGDNLITKYEYLNGFQDRRERSFLGFGVVKTHNMSTSNQAVTVYRTSISEYATNISDTEPNLFVGCLDNRIRQYFYKKGIVTKTYMLDGLGRKHSEVNYTYKYYNPAIPTPTTTIADYNTTSSTTIQDPTATISASSFTDNTRVLPLLVATKSTVWEFDSETAGASSHWKEQYNSIDLYDKYGNVKQYQDKGASLSDISDDIKVNMLYFYNTNNVVNVPMEHRVTNNSVVFRLSRNFIDGIGRINQIKKYLTTSLTTNFAQYDIEYDSFGNIKKITHPFGVNLSDTRMSYTYTYDPTTQTYPTDVLDAYGYSSSTKYRFDFGVPIMTVDANHSVITYDYDSFGRPIAVKGPYESSWTIKNQYFPNQSIPVATTAHFDGTGEIYTSTFIDGLQRVIQTKKELQNCNCLTNSSGYRFSVSGKVLYDEFGRATDSYLNYDESNCDGVLNDALLQFILFPDDHNQLTSTTYDYLDRPLSTTVHGLSAGDATTTMYYSFGQDRNGVTQFLKQITLPNGNVSQSYSDSKGRVTSSNQVGNQDTYWTSFEYDKINQLKNVKDANQAITYYTYDNFGRKLTTNHPDAGLATFKYDLASRLKESTNANLLAAGQKVLYKYNINQLTNVIFPSHTVTYSYGAVGAPSNGIGRLIYQSDLTGVQAFKYGSLGEVTENKRIIIDPLGASRTFVTNFNYDTWGRIRTLIYPDGEKVNYTYDNGGLLTHIENGDGQVYLTSICYDQFEQRTSMIYGNNTYTNYTYEPQQLLQQMYVHSSTGSVFMSNKYNYDLNSNVTQIDNGASGAALYHLGGTETKSFAYDEFNRLQHSEGNWHGELEEQQFTLDMEYNSLHNIVSKVQSHQSAPLGTGNFTDTPNSMSNYYSYTGGNHPHAPSTIDVFDPSTGGQTEQINNTYDANGNLKQISHDDLNSGSSTTRDIYWDEQNRLQAIAENGVAYHYVYDASGERVLKSSGSTANLVVNGEQVTALTNPGNYTMYPSGYLVVGTHDYTKHYYAGSQRIATRMGDLSTVHNFQSFASGQGTAGSSEALKQQGELETKKQFLQKQLTDIYAKAKLGKPNFTITQATIDPAEAACQAEYNALLQYWYLFAMNGGGNRDCYISLLQTYEQTQTYCQTMVAIKKEAKCYINMDSKKLPIWWYHPDHLGSSSYLTDFSGLPSHYYNYLPFGEEMVSQNNSSYNNVYRFSGKELDQETGLSYFGARYYDPKYSFWLSVDPLAEAQPNKTPYHYCSNNPINRTDPTGMLDGEYYDSQTGKKVYDDGINDGKVYIRETKYVTGTPGNPTFKKQVNDTYIGQKDQIPDKTEAFNKQMELTNKFFSQKNQEFNEKEENILGGWGGKYKDRLDYFKSQVGYDMDFDIKVKEGNPFNTQGSEGKVNFKNNYGFYNGNLLRGDDFGNINYGVAGKAFGFSDFVLKAAAGWAQILHPDSPTGKIDTYFDEPRDTYNINRGINYWTKYLKK